VRGARGADGGGHLHRLRVQLACRHHRPLIALCALGRRRARA
jgi:hypothetical protein